MKMSGKVYVCGDNVDTDVIIPARYLNLFKPGDLAKHAMEDLDKEFLKKPHEIVVAGRNFGCGSSREHAPIALKASGVRAVIAESFARIFYRNAMNVGLPAVILKEAGEVKENASIDLENGIVESAGKKFSFAPLRGTASEILNAGGLVMYLKNRLKSAKRG